MFLKDNKLQHKVPGPTDLIWWQWQRGHTRTHLEHGRPDYMFWSLTSMVLHGRLPLGQWRNIIQELYGIELKL